jgi:hypothetical protein
VISLGLLVMLARARPAGGAKSRDVVEAFLGSRATSLKDSRPVGHGGSSAEGFTHQTGEVAPAIPLGLQLDIEQPVVVSETARNGGGGYAVQTAVNGGSELLIFVPLTAHGRD